MDDLDSARYLTPEAKGLELERWASLRTRGGGGAGAPDPEIFPLCDDLNVLPGVCTLQSCAGHRRNGTFWPGHVWLWLDRRTSERFDRRASELAASAVIERVSRIYAANGQEITAIEFCGNERGLLAESKELLRRFFYSL